MAFFPPTVPSAQPSKPTQQEIEDFTNAVRNNDMSTVDRMIGLYGKDVIEARDNIRAIGLTWAVFYGNLSMVRHLLDCGADVNGRGTDDRPALTWAVVGDHIDIAKELLQRGASVDLADNRGMTPMTEATTSYLKNDQMIDLLTRWPQELKQRKEEAERIRGEKQEAEENAKRAQKQLESVKKINIKLKKRNPRPGP